MIEGGNILGAHPEVRAQIGRLSVWLSEVENTPAVNRYLIPRLMEGALIRVEYLANLPAQLSAAELDQLKKEHQLDEELYTGPVRETRYRTSAMVDTSRYVSWR